jgi:hypothetical protein
MNSNVSNPCTRCGRQRIQTKKWKEKIATLSGRTTIITRAINICPDKECQKVVDKELLAQKAKRDKIKEDREKRVKENLMKKAAVRQAHLLKTA